MQRFKMSKSIIKVFSVLILLCAVICTAQIIYPEAAGDGEKAATILFTHDTHSHVYPTYDSEGKGLGGYT